MNTRLMAVALSLLAALWNARGDVVTARSFSGQFTASELRAFEPSGLGQHSATEGAWAFLINSPPKGVRGHDEVTLEPSLLVLSSERMKNSLISVLHVSDQWQGGVHMVIRPDWPENHQPALTANHDPHGWSYELAFPKFIQKEVLVRALMETMLLEIANRGAGDQSAEIPFWLVEGMSAHLEAYNVDGLVLQPSMEISKVRLQGVDAVRDQLRHRQPFSFQRLSWPAESDLSGEGLQLYRCCAQLFLENLLQFSDGRAGLLATLRLLPRHLNWQSAFLGGFQAHFDTLLDVEKWWSLNCVEFARQDIGEPLAPGECWKKLQAALDVPVQVHFASNQMPAEADITLQEAIAQWPQTDAHAALCRTIGDLQALHYRAPASMRELVDLYLQTLVSYATGGTGARSDSWFHWETAPAGTVKKNIIAQLDALDKRRQTSRPAN